MNKIFLILTAVIGLLVLVALGVMVLSKSKKAPEVASTQAPTPTSTSLISSIKDALAHSVSLSCSFTTPEGVKTVASIKNGMIRSDFTGNTAQKSGSVIMRDKKIYFWNGTTGMIMSVPEVTPSPSVNPTGSTTSQGQDVMENLEQYKAYCHPATVADSLFVIPTNVKFQDTSSMMKGVSTGTMMPATTGVPTQYQQMMRQLTPTQ